MIFSGKILHLNFPQSAGTIAERVACIENAHEADINSVDWSKREGDDIYLASASDEGLVKVWRLQS